MKVLVFPVLLAIAIITGPPKTNPDHASTTAPAKTGATATMARTQPAPKASLATNAPAAPLKDATHLQTADLK